MVEVDIISNHHQFIHASLHWPDTSYTTQFTAIYGSPTPSLRKVLWSSLSNLQVSPSTPWLLAGDFNATLAFGERQGGRQSNTMGCKSFINFVSAEQLVDLGFSVPRFTWRMGSLFARLDRALANDSWISHFPDASVQHLPKIGSDHRPILIHFDRQQMDDRPRPFRFLAPWITHPDFPRLVKDSWSIDSDLTTNIVSFQHQAATWNREIFGHIGKRKRRLEAQLKGIQQSLEQRPSLYLMQLEQDLCLEYENTCLQEEMLWMQKSRDTWIKLGDRNTAYFHSKTIARR